MTTMVLPLLKYGPTSSNHRVAGFEMGGDEQPRVHSADTVLAPSEMDDLIRAVYRQILNEQQMTRCTQQIALESQLRSGQITVREFVQGVATSDVFRRRNYETNNNYRFAQMCVQRLLGRDIYNDQEKYALSIVAATKGLNGLVDHLVNSEEYLANFGDTIVPYQRRRILAQRTTGDLPFARMARYDEFYRDNLAVSKGGFGSMGMNDYRWAWQKNPPAVLAQAWNGIILVGAGTIALALAAALFHL
jgi:phycobilisome rod-core linker protein